MKPCLSCGVPSEASHCDEHGPKSWQHREGSARARGYDRAWDKLSARARKAQRFCSLCGATDELTTDHLPIAWQRKAEGKVIRLRDVQVLCSGCNVDAGTSRPDSDRAACRLDTHGGSPIEGDAGPRGKAQVQLQSLPPSGGAR